MKTSQIQYHYFALNMLVNTSAVYDVWIFNMSEPFGYETTPIIQETDDCDRYDSTIRSRTRFFMLAVIIPLGLLFNTIAFAVLLSSPRLRKNTSTLFLIALTIADSSYLTGELLRWLCSWDAEWKYIFGLDFTNRFDIWCRTMYFLRYFGQFASSWLTVAITSERFLCVWSPLKISGISTKTSTLIIIIGIAIISISLNLYPFWTLESTFIKSGGGFYTCTYVAPRSTNYDPWFWAIFRIGSLIIPGICVIVLTILIMIKFNHISDERRQLQYTSENNPKNINFQVGAMLLLVAIAFLILRLPYCIMSFVHDLTQGVAFGCNLRMDLAYEITSCVAIVNYGVNLFLYCLSGSIFRDSFIAAVTCTRRQAPTGPNGTLYTTIARTSVYRFSANFSRKQSFA